MVSIAAWDEYPQMENYNIKFDGELWAFDQGPRSSYLDPKTESITSVGGYFDSGDQNQNQNQNSHKEMSDLVGISFRLKQIAYKIEVLAQWKHLSRSIWEVPTHIVLGNRFRT